MIGLCGGGFIQSQRRKSVISGTVKDAPDLNCVGLHHIEKRDILR